MFRFLHVKYGVLKPHDQRFQCITQEQAFGVSIATLSYVNCRDVLLLYSGVCYSVLLTTWRRLL